jgi:LytS/YehU family sensor histidine kinase
MKKYKLLYVDDEADNLFAFKAVFRRYYDIQFAESGEEALALMAENDVDLVISDQRMPEMTGVELFARMRESHPHVIRMVMTGYSDMQAIIDAINKGNIYYYITKPWKAEELRLIIDKALETYSLRKKNEALEKKNILAQFEILKNQINPHFLFNSMNVLGALIQVEPDKALQFTRKFSKLYRNILQLRAQLLISLREELDFVKAYLELQLMRFEGALQVEIDIPTEWMQASLPPFAMQTVLENAIKHNIVSESQPLKVSISLQGQGLAVRNNLQRRAVVEDSTGTGLQNLRSRYAMLGSFSPRFEEDENSYLAWLPLVPAE